MKTTIVMAVHNLFAWTNCCLNSLVETTNLQDNEVIVVDNGSTTKVSNCLKDFKEQNSDKNIKILRNNSNSGSYRAWNQAISESNDSKYIVVVHNDCIFSNSWLDNLVDFYENNDLNYQIGCISPATNYGDGDYISSKDLMNRYLSYKYNNKQMVSADDIGTLLKKTYSDGIGAYAKNLIKNMDKVYRVAMNIATFCFLMPRKIYQDYGPFDESFYPHTYSEKLFKYQLDKNGYAVLCYLGSFVHHNGNSTSDGQNNSLPLIEAENKSLYEVKMKKIYLENMEKPY